MPEHPSTSSSSRHEAESGPILDPQTGAYSIEYFEHQLRSQIAYALRHDESLSVILFAVDHMDELTRAFGEKARDGMLVRVANTVREEVREEDVLARYGPAEFALLCRDTPGEAAGFLATRLRQSVEAAGLTHQGMELPITVSLGIAGLTPPEERSSELIRRAEAALTQARATGNCSVIAD